MIPYLPSVALQRFRGATDAFSSRILGDGAVAFWRLAETSGTVAKDSAGNHDATYFGTGLVLAASTAVSGLPCPYFDGSTAGVEIPTFLTAKWGYTFMIWVDLGDWVADSDNHGTLLKIGNVSTGPGIGIGGSGSGDAAGNYMHGLFDGAAFTYPSPQPQIPRYGVHCFHMSVSATGAIAYYLDGVKVGIGTAPAGSTVPVGTISIGNDARYATRFVKGRLSDAAIFTTVLTDEQVATQVRLGFAQVGVFKETFNGRVPVSQMTQRLGAQTISYDSATQSMQSLVSSAGNNFMSFDRYPLAGGRWAFEMDVTAVTLGSDQHFGFYTAAFSNPGGNQGERIAQINNQTNPFYVRWDGGAYQDSANYPNPSAIAKQAAGTTRTWRLAFDGRGNFELFADGVSMGVVNNLVNIRGVPGLFNYGNTLKIGEMRTYRYADIITPVTNKNIAYEATFKPVAGLFSFTGSSLSTAIAQNTFLTDEVTASNAFGSVIPVGVSEGTIPVGVEIDLGAQYNINRITVWHYWTDLRTYTGTKTEVSADGITWFSVFDSATSGTYAESSTGHVVNFTTRPVRYIRDWARGSSANASSHWVDIKAQAV